MVAFNNRPSSLNVVVHVSDFISSNITNFNFFNLFASIAVGLQVLAI